MSQTLLYSLMVAAMLLAQPARSATPQPPIAPSEPPNRAGIIAVRIATDRATYGIGDHIKLRITLINRGAQELNVDRLPPYALTEVEVVDAQGRTVAPNASPDCDGCVTRAIGLPLPPGEPVVVGFFDPDNHWAPAEWANIRHWGYQIKQSGHYTIWVVPYLRAIGTGVDQFLTSPADKSNAVHITVVRGPVSGYATPTPHPVSAKCNVGATVTNAVQPKYPVSARDLAPATVEVEVSIGPSGNVLGIRVTKSSGNTAIDQAVVRAARQSTFSPKLVNCEPTQGDHLFRAVVQPR